MNRMRNFQVDPKRFELILDQVRPSSLVCLSSVLSELREGRRADMVALVGWSIQYLRYWKNFALGSPVSHAVTYATYLTMEKYYTPEEYITELESGSHYSFCVGDNGARAVTKLCSLHFVSDLKPEDVQEFIPRLFERMHIDALVHGNMLKDVGCRPVPLGGPPTLRLCSQFVAVGRDQDCQHRRTYTQLPTPDARRALLPTIPPHPQRFRHHLPHRRPQPGEPQLRHRVLLLRGRRHRQGARGPSVPLRPAGERALLP